MKEKKTKEQIEAERFERIARRSYDAYKRNREKWIFKGYALADALTEEEYKEDLKTAQEAGISKNFARSMAHDDIGITYSRARKLMSHINENEVLKEEFKDFNVTTLTSNSMRAHDVISKMYSLGLIDDRAEFEKSLGY